MSFAEIATAFPWFFPLVVCLIGACVGSFLNVVIYRVPKNESIVSPGSHCGCGQPIKWHDNIPVLSWLILRGKARCCGRSFSFRYPFIELLTAALFVTCWLRLPPLVAGCGMVFIAMLIGGTFIDLDHFILPDAFTYGLAAVGIMLSIAVPALHGQTGGYFLLDATRSAFDAIVGLFIGSAVVLWIALVAEKILKKEAMGFGDVTFAGAIGTFCGWQGAVFAIFGGSCVGVVWTFTEFALRKITGRQQSVSLPSENAEGQATSLGLGAHVPYGPMMAIAAALYFLFFRRMVLAWFGEVAQLF
jgi:leader peptidase (prepilin peptidase)/N-methyltransferase